MGTAKTFEELEVWQKSIELAVSIYRLTLQEPLSKDFSLKDQIRRASTSVSNNIAEGFEYNSNNQFVKFLRIAKGSLGEVRSQLIVLHRINYISKEDYERLYSDCISLSKQIYSFINYLEKYNQ